MGLTGTRVTDDSPALHRTGSILGWPVYPVVDQVWEYWIYSDVGPGIEVTFIQPYHPGPFTYAEPPHGIGAADRTVEMTWQRMNPRVVVDAVSAGTPERYLPDFATGPLDFYFDSARFKGGHGLSDLEVYFGIPVGGLTFTPAGGDRHVAHVERGLALYTEGGQRVHRSTDDLELYSDGVPDTSRLAFVPALERVSLQPGTYRMSVQVLDTESGRSQVYNQQVTLEHVGSDSLAMSDIQMASLIRRAERGRFLKGDVAVVPNPTRTYLKDHPVFLYYEIYNLNRDAFGATRYRVSYEVQSAERRPVGVRVLRTLGRLLGRREDQHAVVIEYEHLGERADERGYLQLDMSSTEAGDQVLTVRVTDENSGQMTQASERFGIR